MEKIKCFWFCPAVAMFYVLDAASVTDLNFNTDDSGSNFLIPEHTIKQYNKSKGCISHLRLLMSVVCITQLIHVWFCYFWILDGLTKVVFMKHSNAADLLPVPDINYTILKDILSASIPGFDVRDLNDPVTFTMKLQRSRRSGSSIATPLCSFWNFSKG